jgi:hypothetical protein
MTDITSTPVVLTAQTAADTVVTRLDVAFSGTGHIIDLTLTDDSAGRFVLKGRNLVRTGLGAPVTGPCQVSVKATQRGNDGNTLTKTIVLPVQ